MSSAPPYPKPRRSRRAPATQRVDIEWKRQDGARIREEAETEVVSAHGALLRSSASPPRESEIILRDLTTHQAVRARVVRVVPPAGDGLGRVAVELADPSQDFWGSPERRTSSRYEVGSDTFAYFYPADAESTGRVRNLSLGGVYIEDSGNNFAVDDELDLVLRLEKESLTFRVVVTRSYPNKGFAARFLDYSTELKQQLEKYLRNIS